MFDGAAIKGFGNAIMLRRVGRSEASFGTVLLEISSEFITAELTAAIGTKSFNVRALLWLCPSRERLVGLKGPVFGAKHFKSGVASMIVT